MPTTTTPPPPAPPPPALAEPRGGPAAALLAGALLAAAELLLGFGPGRFPDLGRAEALIFLLYRPWLLLAAAVLAASWRTRDRALLYAAFLLTAAAAETALVTALGAERPWGEAARGLAAGAALVLLFDLAVQAVRRRVPRAGRWAAGAVLALLIAVPQTRGAYDAVLLAETQAETPGEHPAVLLMTGLPLVWGEGGPFDPGSRPALAYSMLAREFDFRPVDVLDARSLQAGTLLFLAQPQRLAPAELAALDAWIRAGGRALILADPRLDWPSALPLGDIRRPPPAHLLSPLLSHWGVEMEEPAARGLVYRIGRRRLAAQASSSVKRGPACSGGIAARCAIGRGRAILVADADLMRDDLWAPLGPERHRRMADNPLIVADWLDQLAGIERPRLEGDVAWRTGGRPVEAMRHGLLVVLLVALAGAAGLLRARRRRG